MEYAQTPNIVNGVSDLPILFPVTTKRGVPCWALMFKWKTSIDGWEFVIPAHSCTNFASIPWVVRWLLSPTDPALALPAIIHDYLVSEFGPVANNGLDTDLSDVNMRWKLSAKVFLRYANQYDSTTIKIKCQLAYVALRFFGKLRRKK